jgi:DNA-directed RNA polymerase subunit RPC12/RpoP
MREYYYFACNKCMAPLRSIVDNPSGHVKCSTCGNLFFHDISKAEYDCVRGMKAQK